MIFEVFIMLCNTDILFNVTPIFIQAMADSFQFWLLCTYCTILTKLCYCHQINMMSGSNNVAYEELKTVGGGMKDTINITGDVEGKKKKEKLHWLTRTTYVANSVKSTKVTVSASLKGAASVSERIRINEAQSMSVIHLQLYHDNCIRITAWQATRRSFISTSLGLTWKQMQFSNTQQIQRV